MTRLSTLTLSLLTALLLACGPVTPLASIDRSAGAALAVVGASAPSDAPEVRAENAPTFSGSSALQHVQALAVGIGSRVAGSPTQSQTHQYLMARYQELGYQVELQPFTITAYQDRGSSVALNGQTVSANTLQYSAGGSAQGELVEAGLGSPADYEDAGVVGKVALVTRGGEIRFAEKVSAAAAAGAVAIIVANNAPGNVNGSLVSPSTIPAVTVSQADGSALRQAIRAGGATVRVDVNASSDQSTGANVVATKPGGPQTVVVGAHMDSVAAGPGANDNGSGTSVVLELARVMANRQTPLTLKFVDFDAEEIGLIGSSYYVSQLSDAERQSIVGMVNLDMVGVGNESKVGGTESLQRLARASAARTGLELG
jgi:aminopeptidase YwaD